MVSQTKLALRSGCDHSYISRLEGGNRTPTRDMVIAIARALELDAVDRDRLLTAYGFLPGDIESLISSEPETARLYALLSGDAVPSGIKDMVRIQLNMIATQMEVWG